MIEETLPYTKILNERSKKLLQQPSLIREFARKASELSKNENKIVLDFTIGNPDYSPPIEFSQSLAKLCDNPPSDLHCYQSSLGRDDTRTVFAQEFSKWHGIKLKKDNVILSCGATAGLNVLFHCMLSEGSEVIIVAPFFPEYLNIIEERRAKAVIVAVDASNNLNVPAIEAAITNKTVAIILTQPHNPTGRVYQKSNLKDLSNMLMRVYASRRAKAKDFAEKNEAKDLRTDNHSGSTSAESPNSQSPRPIFVVCDEPYRRLNHTPSKVVPSLLPIYPHTIIVSSFSKDFAIPGERIGFIILHPCLTSPVVLTALEKAINDLGFVNAPSLMQFVLRDALPLCTTREDGAEGEARKEKRRGDIVKASQKEEIFEMRGKAKEEEEDKGKEGKEEESGEKDMKEKVPKEENDSDDESAEEDEEEIHYLRHIPPAPTPSPLLMPFPSPSLFSPSPSLYSRSPDFIASPSIMFTPSHSPSLSFHPLHFALSSQSPSSSPSSSSSNAISTSTFLDSFSSSLQEPPATASLSSSSSSSSSSDQSSTVHFVSAHSPASSFSFSSPLSSPPMAPSLKQPVFHPSSPSSASVFSSSSATSSAYSPSLSPSVPSVASPFSPAYYPQPPVLPSSLALLCLSLNRRKQLLLKVIRKAGLECCEAEAALFLFPKVPDEVDDVEFANLLLQRYSVAVVPGSAFGVPNHVRFSFCCSLSTIRSLLLPLTEAVREVKENAKRENVVLSA
ncbi:Aspartate aminotransferase 2 [Monocercomonoides exilis]|uniref:Aspartate aminotransferase 2 n=1 Tax=Monocercomonoides exilis TaxID=2049356 RepID=UPI00355A5E13|nr:Aspartate aminotransferase 2 [Monocercomonoides exilis]|eukprot:MONOS_5164.1-p1 / transcript=MONOS_5164.1 / gene=MONOS_5164 / organism=Monocercomonoides_exilis_PA203 / gene_product=Aspartate aminotransferase 2 / transcript_product=Aspartate aminotransferase 2 / location=Mono_scaffold00147:53012-56256(+) / protein_length=732 / sequence_SO=supercontig / SO=protein_coding / is_pseudo=false